MSSIGLHDCPSEFSMSNGMALESRSRPRGPEQPQRTVLSSYVYVERLAAQARTEIDHMAFVALVEEPHDR